MLTQVTTERTYSVSIYKPGQRNAYGISVSVSGDKKAKVLKEVKELLEKAQTDALEVHKSFFPDKVESKDETD